MFIILFVVLDVFNYNMTTVQCVHDVILYCCVVKTCSLRGFLLSLVVKFFVTGTFFFKGVLWLLTVFLLKLSHYIY